MHLRLIHAQPENKEHIKTTVRAANIDQCLVSNEFLEKQQNLIIVPQKPAENLWLFDVLWRIEIACK